MKRWVRSILISLLLGVVATVGVAWGCTIWVTVPVAAVDGGWLTTQDPKRFFIVRESAGTTIVNFTIWFDDATGVVTVPPILRDSMPHWSVTRRNWIRQDNERVATVIEHARGWPCLAVISFDRSRSLNRNGRGPLRHSWGIRLAPSFGELVEVNGGGRSLPLRPIMPGFLINTALYAFVVWLLFLGPRDVRQYLRQRRGRCLRCGYDLRGNSGRGCPECGWNRPQEPHPDPGAES